MDHGYCRKYKRVGLQDDLRKAMRNVTQGCFLREIGRYKNTVPSEFQWAAEDRLIDRNKYEEMKCQLPGTPRSTFLMVFSPDGKRVASTHGNHNVYVTDLRTGKNIQTLTGHPRTPWCIAFHPSSNQILASGCLGGQVRVWDLHGGSEVWTTEGQTVIASLAFHPVDRMLVIATYNELHFWDWSQPEPFAKCTTKTEREKVRYVSFDRLGTKLITGIANPVNIPSQWDRVSNATTSQPQFTVQTTTSTTISSSNPTTTVASTSTSTDQGRSITYCYRHLVNQYNMLYRRYFHLMQPRMIPTMDRGTDPMDLVDLQNAAAAGTSNDNNNNTSSNSVTTTVSNNNSDTVNNNICVCHGSNNSSNNNVVTTSSQNLQNEATSRPVAVTVTTTATLTTTSTISTAPLRLIEIFPRSSTSSSGAVTNPTYTSYNERGIFSTRENSSRSPIRVFVEESCSRTQPYERSRSRTNSQQEDEEVERNLSRPRLFLNPIRNDNNSPSVNQDSRVFEVVGDGRDGRDRSSVRPAFGLIVRNREANNSQNPRHFLFRPGGQFVLSRHSNSPFQPRKPHPIDNSGNIPRNKSRPVIPSRSSSFSSSVPGRTNPVTTTVTRPAVIPSCWSSFSTSTTRLPSCWSNSNDRSRAQTPSCSSTFTTRTPIPSTSSNDFPPRNRLYFFDRVKTLLRDRILNSPESANSDSTINFSNMEIEPNVSLDNEIRNLLDNNEESSVLGPRGLDPMLSSTADNSEPPSSLLITDSNGNGNGNEASTSDLNISQPEFPDPWESEQINPSPPLVVDEPTQNQPEQNLTPSPEFSIRQGVQILSLHIENMQRLCRARIEILQLQQIRKMWEDLTTQIRSLHTLVQDSRNWLQPPEPSSRDPIIPSVSHLMRLAISDNPTEPPQEPENPNPAPSAAAAAAAAVATATPSTSAATTSANPDNHYKKLVESMVNALLDDKNQPSTSSEAPRSSDRNETEEPQPGPSGLQNQIPNRENLKMRIYRAIRNIIQKARRKRDLRTSPPNADPALRLNDSSRPRFRHRHHRHSVDSATAIRREVNTSVPVSTEEVATPSTSRSTPPNDACQSCGQRKRPFKDFIRQKRRSTDSRSNSGSKVLKNSSGKRSEPSTSRVQDEQPSTSQAEQGPSTSGVGQAQKNPTTELLRRMIERMETMVRFQREAFRRTEELAGSRSRRSESRSLPNSGDSSDTERNNNPTDQRQYFRLERKLLRRAEFLNNQSDTQLRARRLLGYMVQSLTEFFEESSNDASRVLDEQITNLYTLLHLALELTDLLMEQLNATSRDLETNFSINNGDGNNSSEGRNPGEQSSLSARGSRRYDVRNRSNTRQLSDIYRRSREVTTNPSNNTDTNRRIYPNPFLRSPSRANSNRLNTSQPLNRSNTFHYRSSAISASGYRRLRRFASRTSTPMPQAWYNRNEETARTNQDGTTPTNPPENYIRFSNFVPRRFFSANGDDHGVEFRELRPVTPRDLLHINNSNNNNNNSSNNNNNNNNNNNVNNNNSNNNNNNNNTNNGNNNDNSSTTPFSPHSWSSSNEEPSFQSRTETSSNNEASERDQSDARMIQVRFRVEQNPQTSTSNANEAPLREGSFTIPVVQVNDVPVPDVTLVNQSRNRIVISPVPRQREDIWRWRPWRPRFLHPRYFGPNPFEDQDSNDVSENIHYYRMGFSVGLNHGGWSTLDPSAIIADAPLSPHHRIQAWDFSKMTIPDISDREANGVVAECKIHNDASVDISRDGHLLVTLLPSGRHSLTTTLGVYSLDWNSLGQLLYKTGFVQNAVSVSLSPTNRHLLVGLASRPLMLRDRTCMGQIFRLEGARPRGTWSSGQGRLVHMRDLEHSRETTTMSINCIRWAPGAGEGFVYGTNTGQLKVLR